jgi:hypothetical protein
MTLVGTTKASSAPHDRTAAAKVIEFCNSQHHGKKFQFHSDSCMIFERKILRKIFGPVIED